MIYTFYSFKGGVGRSMALANVAELLYRRGANVLIVDFDLEAPGLERYFAEPPASLSIEEIQKKRGIIDLLISYREMRLLPSLEEIDTEKAADQEASDKFPYAVEPLTNFIAPIYERSAGSGSLAMITAGARDGDRFTQYAKNVRSFDWGDLYSNWNGEQFFEWFRLETEKIADYVLIDSRTGVTEMSGVCTYQLADTVAMFVSANQQNLDGTLMMAKSLSNPELVEEGRSGRKLSLLFVPSRVEHSDSDLLDRFSDDFYTGFGEFVTKPSKFEKGTFIELKIPYLPSYSFMEKVAVRESEKTSAFDLIRAFEKLTETLLFQGNDPELAKELYNKARTVWDSGNRSESIELVSSAINLFEKLRENDFKTYSLALAQALDFRSDLFDKNDAYGASEDALRATEVYFDLYDRAPDKFGEESISALTALSNRLHEKGQVDAIPLLSRLINVQESIEPESIELARNLSELANWLIEQEQYSEAFQYSERAVQIYERVESTERNSVRADFASALITRSESLLEINEMVSALRDAIKSVEIFDSLYVDDPRLYEIEAVKAHNALLDIISRGEITNENGSLRLVREAEKFFRQQSQANPKRYMPDLAKVLNMLTDPLIKNHEIDKAIENQNEAVKIFTQIRSSHGRQYESDLAGSLFNLGGYLSLKGDFISAKNAAMEALEIYERLAAGSPREYREQLKETRELIDSLADAPSRSEILRGSKPTVTIGTLGHIGHGKTTLTAAISKVLSKYSPRIPLEAFDLDNATQEKARGVTIATAHVEYETANRHYIQIDPSGHADYGREMIIGAARMDGAILVVAATDGPMPQTREHIILARQVGVPAMVVFMNKVEMVESPELLELVELEIRELLSAYEFPGDDTPVIQGSALKVVEGDTEWEPMINELMQAVDDYIPTPMRETDKPFLMPVEDVMEIEGKGTVVTGRIERGVINVNESVEIVGIIDTRTTVVTWVKMFDKSLPGARAGDNVSLLLKGIDRKEIERGQVIVTPGSIKPHTKFKAESYVLTKEEGGRQTPFFTGYRPQFYFRTTDMTGVARLPAGVEAVMPGDNIQMEIELIAPIALEKGLRFVIREGGRTVGAGTVSEIIE